MAATLAFVLAQLWGDVTGNQEITERLEKTVPKTLTGLNDLHKAVTDIKQEVAAIPTEQPTPIVRVVSGTSSVPVPVITMPPKTVVITTPGPTKTVTPEPAIQTPPPKCGTALLGRCLVP